MKITGPSWSGTKTVAYDQITPGINVPIGTTASGTYQCCMVDEQECLDYQDECTDPEILSSAYPCSCSAVQTWQVTANSCSPSQLKLCEQEQRTKAAEEPRPATT
jgi:hypothetical protein